MAGDRRAAAPLVELAQDAVAAALRGLVAADDVAWTTPAASRYRAMLAEGAAAVQAARVRLEAALDAATRHDAAVARAREAEHRAAAAAATGWMFGGTG